MKPENAIQQDANNAGQDQQHDDQQDQQPRFLSARDQAMAAIEQQIERQYVEMGALDPQTVDTAHEGGQSTDTPAAASAVPVTDRQQVVRVKVDGEERELPLEEVVKGYQIDAAARKRLEEATLKQKELERKERELAEREARLQGGSDDDQSLSGTTPDESAKEKARALVERLIEGDIDEAAEMLAGVIGGGSSAAVDESKITSMISQAEAQRDFEREMKAAKQLFDAEFAEINKDPNLAKVANDIFAAEIQAGRLPTEAARAAGSGTREWLQQLTGRADGAAANRTARKQTIDTLPRAGVRSAGNRSDDESVADVIADMRRLRGQLV